MGCSASRADGLEHEEALQHVIQMMRELKVKQIANIAARREGRRSREKYYGWAGVHALGDVDKDIRLWRFGVQRVAMHSHGDAPTTARTMAAAVALVKPILSSRLGAAVVAGPGPGAPRVADASVVLFDEGRGPASTAPRPALLLDLGAGGLADGINSLQADGGTGERLLEHFVSIRGEGSRAPPMWGLLSLSLETSSCVIYTFFQRSGNRERYAVVIRGVICGLS